MISNTQLLDIAKKQLGNGGSKYRSYVGASGNYCNMFVYWLYNANGCASLLPLPATKYYRTYCPDSIKWCRKNLAEIPPYLAMACDVIYMDWEPNGVPNHIGIVDHPISTSKIATVEGNTSGTKNGKSVSGIVAAKTRNTKYTTIFRPHFRGNINYKPLTIDGGCGYNTIAGLQKALQILKYYTGSIDGILGQATVRAIQKLCGAKQDGAWGPTTSGKLQQYLKDKGYYTGKLDKAFGKQSVIALQEFINANAFSGVSDSTAAVTKPVEAAKPTTATKPADMAKPSGKYFGAMALPTLKKGSTGENVSDLQKFLNWYSAAFALKVDGGFGDLTDAAVKAFQESEGIKLDGVYGSASLAKAQQYASNASKLLTEMKRLAWPNGTAKSKYDYKTGSPIAACKAAMQKLGYKTKAKMSDCGNFINTIVRGSGVDTKFTSLHAVKKAFPKTEDKFDIVLDGKPIPEGFLKPADLIRYKKINNSQHAMAYYGDGKVCDAGHYDRFGNIRKDEKRYAYSNVITSTIQVLRVKEQ